MMNMTKRLYFIFGALVILAILLTLFSTTLNKTNKNHYSLVLVKVDGGWGYQILKDQKTLIYQPYIPVIEGNQAFPDKQSANEIGKLVIQRLEKNMNPAVSKDDLIKLHIPGI